MSGKLTPAKMMLLGLSAGLIPCLAVAVDMPANPLTERVDETHLGEMQSGVTARTQTGWTVQVGAYADKDKADAQLEKLASDRPAELAHAARLVTPLKWDDTRTLYRARFTGLTLEAASALCASLNGIGQACFLSQGDKAESKSYLREAVVVTDDMRGTGLEAPVDQAAANAALHEALTAIPELSMIAEGPTADKTIAPKLVALNDKLAGDKSGQISNAELSGMRGGFFTAGGAQFDFGASIKTMVNGQLALQTNLTWTPQGPDISSLSGLGQQIANQVQSSLAQAGIGAGAPSAPATTANNIATPANHAASNPAAAASNLAANTASNAINSAAGSSAKAPAVTTSAATTPQTTVTIPSMVSSVTVPGSGGSTTVLNNIGANQIQSMILNTASGQRIDQNTNVMLTIYNLQQWQQQLAQHALSSQLAGEIMSASGLGH
jgi:hypothetical protein